MTGEDAEALIVRPRDTYDGALPAGASVAAMALLRFEQISKQATYGRAAEAILKIHAPQMQQSPLSLTAMLGAVEFHLGPRQQIVVAGTRSDETVQAMLAELRGHDLPNATVLLHEPAPAGRAEKPRRRSSSRPIRPPRRKRS